MYRFKFPNDPDRLLDGRSIIFISKEISKPRERVALLVKGVSVCDISFAEKIVNRCKPGEKVSTYFEKTDIKRKGKHEWQRI